ncbi:hypothetical protein Q1695_010672 [Nippostrongylus brasiliensis]|nr:hypothetical protein Q1695_010672 [Nippostrongylus brasiliensis]
MSAGHYHRRWSANTAGRNTPNSQTLASSVEPSTYGTSWNSVRWNKPSTAGYKSHSSAIAARFEPKPYYSVSPSTRGSTTSSRYSNCASEAARAAAQITSLGPSVTARASRFDASVRDGGNKYRSEAREILSKWTSRERNGGYYSYRFNPGKLYVDSSSSSRPMENAAASGYLNKTNEYPYRKTASVTPSRTTVPAVSRFSTDRSSVLSLSPMPQPHTPRAERPWRQRLAESSRIRASLGDDYRSRNGSTDSSVLGSRARTSTSYTPSFALSYGKSKADEPNELMSRSYSPVRPRNEIFRSLTSTDQSSAFKASREGRSDSQESLLDDKLQTVHTGVSSAPKNPSIRESSMEREPGRRRKRTSKERTARRTSRQRGLAQSSSSDEEVDLSLTRAEAKRRRRRRMESAERPALPPPTLAANGMHKSLDSSLTKAVSAGDTKSNAKDRSLGSIPLVEVPVTAGSPVPSLTENDGQPDVESVTPFNPGKEDRTRRSKNETVAEKTTSSAVEERTVTKNGSKTKVVYPSVVVEASPAPQVAPQSATQLIPPSVLPKSNDSDSYDDFVDSDESAADASSTVDDESQYSAVVHFTPKKPKVKRIAPVPGLWKVAGSDEFISKNKRLTRETSKESVSHVWTIRPHDTVTKRVKVTRISARKPVVFNNEKPCQATTTKNEVKTDVMNEVSVDQKKRSGTSIIKKLLTTKPKKDKEDEKPERTIEEKKKREEEEEEEETSLKDNKEKEVELKGMKVVSKPTLPKEEQAQISFIFNAKSRRPEGIAVTIDIPRSAKLVNPQNLRERKPLATQSISSSLFRKSIQLGSQKTLVEKIQTLASCSLSCDAASNELVNHAEHLKKKPAQHGAHVTVDKPVADVNISRIRLRIKRPKKLLSTEDNGAPRRSTSMESDSAFHQSSRQTLERSPLSSRQSRAAEVLDDLRDVEQAHVFRRQSREEEYNSAGHLILPDKSLLEEYVKRKRGRLEQLLAEPIPERDEPCCDSPTNSVTSELFPACAVRVYGRSPFAVPVITQPSRSVSRVSSVASIETSTPTVMLDTLSSYSSGYNNFNSTPQGFLRDTSTRIQIAKPIQFDAPKTPFEERIQLQAQANRKASAASLLSTDDRSLDRHSSPRRVSIPSDGMSALSTSFTAAVAANANHTRHERYAAHIPVHKGDNSGRQSTMSVDSQQSGALENATKQLDHVIDQARHKHSQHRNKFKEAIDYLDQIFEDLKKECDTPCDDNKDRVTGPVQHQNGNSQAEGIRRQTAGHSITSKASVTTPKRTLRQAKLAQPPSPVEVVLLQPTAAVDSDSAEVDVTETIVLPKKTDKLDFTRRWLHDDLSSLAHQLPAPIIFMPEPCSYYNDADEHSLGSCSAEVAAINSSEKKEKPKKSNGVATNSLEKPAPIRPQPCRPQPMYGAQGTTSGLRHHNVELEVPNSIPRVSSFDHVSERRDYPSHSWRSGSQEPYQVQGNVPSEDVALRPSPSAFQSVSNFPSRGGNMRGSLRSLPDAGLVIRGRYHQQQPSPMKDPSLAIDQLCAELELNTDQPLTAAEKRRSFPTSYAYETPVTVSNAIYEQPKRRTTENRVQPYQQPKPLYHAAVSTHQTVHQSHSQPMNRVPQATAPHAAQSQLHSIQRSSQPAPFSTHPVVKKTASPQRQQKSLDEVTNMLNNVVNDFHVNQTPRKKQPSSHTLYATPHSINQSNPFETINQEKISPSRVEAMHNMFERNAVPTQNRWSATVQPFHVRPREEETYHDIIEYSNRPPKAVMPTSTGPIPLTYVGPHASPPRNTIGVRNSSPQNYAAEYVPAYPTTQPPSHPPGRNGSATSSQNGGYYSSNSSGVGAPVYQQNSQISAKRGSVIGHQSTSSRAASIADDDDDDGFYDNIGTFDDRRYSRSSEMDVTSLSSHQLPPAGWKPTKIGSLLRKIGGGSRPPGSAASLVSLNKVANETPIKPGNLLKSNSLSNEPWKKMVIDGQSMQIRESTPSKGGFGARIKNSIFGSKRRLNG